MFKEDSGEFDCMNFTFVFATVCIPKHLGLVLVTNTAFDVTKITVKYAE